MPKQVPIVILVWNNWSDTKLLLDSLQNAEIDSPIWIVDNGSTNLKQLQEIKETFPWIGYLRLDMNYGFAGGMNRALKLMANKGFNMAYAINNDCLVNNDFLSPIIKVAETIQNSVILGSRYLSRGSSGQFDTWGFCSNPLEREQYIDGFLQTDRVVGCGMLIKIGMFFAVGGFDERFFCYGEENDLCYRLQRKGYLVGMCFDSLILHNHQGSDIDGNSIYYRIRNSYLLKTLHSDRHIGIQPLFDVIKGAYQNIKNYEIFSSYIEGLYCGRSSLFGERIKSYPKSIVYLLFCYYYLLSYPSRILSFIKKIISRVKHIRDINNIRHLYRKK